MGVWGPSLCSTSVKNTWGLRPHTFSKFHCANSAPDLPFGHNFCAIPGLPGGVDNCKAMVGIGTYLFLARRGYEPYKLLVGLISVYYPSFCAVAITSHDFYWGLYCAHWGNDWSSNCGVSSSDTGPAKNMKMVKSRS